MKLSVEQKNKLKKGFEEAFNSVELPETFETGYPLMYSDMKKDVLAQNGGSENVDIEKRDFGISIHPKTSYEDFAESVEAVQNFGTEEEFLAVAEDLNFYVDYIMKKIQDTQIDFGLIVDPREYLEKNPTKGYLANEMETYFDPKILEERLKDEEQFKKGHLKPAAVAEGFDDEVNLNRLPYKIENLEIKTSYVKLAEYFLDSGELNGDTTVRDFLNKAFYQQIISRNFYECDVVIKTDPLELEEM